MGSCKEGAPAIPTETCPVFFLLSFYEQVYLLLLHTSRLPFPSTGLFLGKHAVVAM